MDLNLLVGTSHFVYGFNDAELRRSGTMRPSQERKRSILEERFGRPDPNATQKQVEELLRRVVRPGDEVVLRSDEHQAYPLAMRRLSDRRFHHERTSSKEARTTANPLFPVNLADMLLRHSSANHKRETIAFSKRRQGALYRMAIWTVWRNYIKDTSENRKTGPPAVGLGLINQEGHDGSGGVGGAVFSRGGRALGMAFALLLRADRDAGHEMSVPRAGPRDLIVTDLQQAGSAEIGRGRTQS
jgi:hypothetical protein